MLWIMAWRNIWRNPIRSLVIILSVVLGIWAGGFISALYWGMGEDRVRIAIENEISHLQLHAPGFREDMDASCMLSNDTALLSVLSHNSAIRSFVFRSIAQAMLTTPVSSAGVLINGTDAVSEDSTTQLRQKIVEGSYFIPGKKQQLLVGKKLAQKYRLRVKSKVVLSCLDTAGNISSAAFRVTGIFQTYNTNWDGTHVFVDRRELNSMLGIGDAAHQVAVLLHSNRQLEKQAIRLRQQFPKLEIKTWQEISPDTHLILSSMSQISVIFMILILLALSFGIINTMLMAILERSREMGMMIALGMNRLRLLALIMLETMLLVLSGCPLGFGMTWMTVLYFSAHGINLRPMAAKTMSSFGFSPIIYPSLPADQYINMLLMVGITALLSAIPPALKAIRIKPAETLKQ